MKKTQKQPDLSIVVPAYREEKRIGKTLDELAKFITTDKTMKYVDIEVIVVSANSPDKTHTIVERKAKLFTNFQFIKPGPKVGKGRDVRAGMLKAKGKAVIFMDADLATPLRHLPGFYKAFLDGAEVVVGTRNLKKHHPEFLRRMLSHTGNILFKILCGVWIEDSQCGFKLFSRRATSVCFKKMTILGWGFDMEVLTIARINGFRMQPIRINDWKSVPGGTFIGNALKNSTDSLKELLYIFWGRLRGRYHTK
jgi:dolichyl-phosphate beta-glucosyltransferase